MVDVIVIAKRNESAVLSGGVQYYQLSHILFSFGESAPKRKTGFALEAVQNGSEIKQVLRSFVRPHFSISDSLKKRELYDPRLGRKATFPKDDRKELDDIVIIFWN